MPCIFIASTLTPIVHQHYEDKQGQAKTPRQWSKSIIVSPQGSTGTGREQTRGSFLISGS